MGEYRVDSVWVECRGKSLGSIYSGITEVKYKKVETSIFSYFSVLFHFYCKMRISSGWKVENRISKNLSYFGKYQRVLRDINTCGFHCKDSSFSKRKKDSPHNWTLMGWFLFLTSLCFIISIILVFFLVTQKYHFTILIQTILTFSLK